MTLPVGALPPRVGDAARRAGFEVACLAVGRLHGRSRIGLISFGVHTHAFAGNIDIVISESMRILDMALERDHDQERLRRAAEQDGLTGLANRLTFGRALNSSSLESSAVLYIDLDHFKRVNDSFGHAVGDAVLVEVGRRIRAECRPADVVARLGGDEFAVLLPDIGPTAAERIAHRVLARISDPLPRDLGPDRIAASGGLAFARTADDSVERADLAMLASKRAGRAQLIIA